MTDMGLNKIPSYSRQEASSGSLFLKCGPGIGTGLPVYLLSVTGVVIAPCYLENASNYSDTSNEQWHNRMCWICASKYSDVYFCMRHLWTTKATTSLLSLLIHRLSQVIASRTFPKAGSNYQLHPKLRLCAQLIKVLYAVSTFFERICCFCSLIFQQQSFTLMLLTNYLWSLGTMCLMYTPSVTLCSTLFTVFKTL